VLLWVHSKEGLQFGLQRENIEAAMERLSIKVEFYDTTPTALLRLRELGEVVRGVVQNMHRSVPTSGLEFIRSLHNQYEHSRGGFLPAVFTLSTSLIGGKNQNLRQAVEDLNERVAQHDPTTPEGWHELLEWVVDQFFGIVKTVVFVRHGQAQHNVPHEGDIHDPLLTELGEQQCEEVRGTGFASRVGAELVVVSPLRRTLQTAILAFGDLQVSFLPHPDLQEVGDRVLCDIGSTKPDLIQWLAMTYPNHAARIPLDFLPDNWYGVADMPPNQAPSGQWRKRGPYAYSALSERMGRLAAWLRRRPERVIVVVAHHGVLLRFLGIEFLNCECKGYWLTRAGWRAIPNQP